MTQFEYYTITHENGQWYKIDYDATFDEVNCEIQYSFKSKEKISNYTLNKLVDAELDARLLSEGVPEEVDW